MRIRAASASPAISGWCWTCRRSAWRSRCWSAWLNQGRRLGDAAPILWKGAVIGIALRTRRGARPLYVSVGHRVSLETAVALVRAACDGRRLPVPIRAAHEAANTARRAFEATAAT